MQVSGPVWVRCGLLRTMRLHLPLLHPSCQTRTKRLPASQSSARPARLPLQQAHQTLRFIQYQWYANERLATLLHAA